MLFYIGIVAIKSFVLLFLVEIALFISLDTFLLEAIISIWFFVQGLLEGR